MSLTALAKLLTGKQYSIAGPKYFKYKGEWLNDIRHRLDKQYIDIRFDNTNEEKTFQFPEAFFKGYLSILE